MPHDRPSPLVAWTRLGLVLLGVLLVPFLLFGEPLTARVEGVLASGDATAATGAILSLLLASDIVLPLPSSVIAVAAGQQLGLAGGAVSIWIGACLGNGLGYLLGRVVGPAGLARFVGDDEVARVQALARTHAAPAAILASTRAIPMLSEAAVVLAGATGMPVARFVAACAVGNSVMAVAYAGAGALAASYDAPWLAVAAAIVLPGLAMVAARRPA